MAPLASAGGAVMSARGPEVAARVGIPLGIAITLCFGTGLISHWIQHPPGWFYWPAHPAWEYRLTQGTHVVSGVVAIPLLLVKLWAVYPRLFRRPLIGDPLRIVERGSIALLVGSVIFQLATGLFNIAQFYAWTFFFTTTHYAMAYVAFGSLAVHLAVKLPVVRAALSRPLEQPGTGRGLPRRAVLTAAGLSAGVAGVMVVGQSVPWLRPLSLLAPRSGSGPQGVPVNRSAAAAGVTTTALDPGYRLTVVVGDRQRAFTRAELEQLPQAAAELPMACVEGWSVSARWTGVPLRDLLAAVGDYRGGDVAFVSLDGGLYGRSVLPHRHVIDASTLVALGLGGADLDLDHGYPARLIAPNRPGVLQTKWLSRIEVLP
ncbi:molybdopterin-dependent oxidoreductase [Nocardia stercoris]|uniref:Molybdopterin-binding protein n=1 Tax=Nocardia stercoris TaxID=2483361 RepID=A0A3M2LI62_9NOCA|nr:molybdopterin-dependent oxidoreductase [Nocardia stercoris]RMI35715.1 molybdopterin-binding protein [Nocardia stercoris]